MHLLYISQKPLIRYSKKSGGASFLLLFILANASDNEEHIVKKLQISNKKLRSLTLCLYFLNQSSHQSQEEQEAMAILEWTKPINTSIIERFSNDCRKTKTKVITLTNHNRNKQRHEPIRIPSDYLKLARSAAKITRTWCDWFWFCFSLVEKLARVF